MSTAAPDLLRYAGSTAMLSHRPACSAGYRPRAPQWRSAPVREATTVAPEELSHRAVVLLVRDTFCEVIMGRPLSPLELQEMAERLPSPSPRKAPRKAARAKTSTKRAAVRKSKRRS
jgi:hypothetical protein